MAEAEPESRTELTDPEVEKTMTVVRQSVRETIGFGVLLIAVGIAGTTGYLAGDWGRKVEKVPGPVTTVIAKPSQAKAKPPTVASMKKSKHRAIPGGFCYPEGTIAYDKAGQLMQCVRRNPDNLARWRD
jgi:hypothetical protein